MSIGSPSFFQMTVGGGLPSATHGISNSSDSGDTRTLVLFGSYWISTVDGVWDADGPMRVIEGRAEGGGKKDTGVGPLNTGENDCKGLLQRMTKGAHTAKTVVTY